MGQLSWFRAASIEIRSSIRKERAARIGVPYDPEALETRDNQLDGPEVRRDSFTQGKKSICSNVLSCVMKNHWRKKHWEKARSFLRHSRWSLTGIWSPSQKSTDMRCKRRA